MTFEMLDVGPRLTPSRLVALERQFGIMLPENYKLFLLKHNGGRPRPNFFPIHGFEGNPFGSIHYFFGIGDGVKSSDVGWNYKTYNGRIPRELLPIAGDGSGNVICLSHKGVNKGFVYYWNHDLETSPPTYDNIYFISDSFDSFLSSLHHRDLSAEIAKSLGSQQHH
jgi:SMI1-KNR4 cell-wall